MARDPDEPTLGEAWAVLGTRLGLAVESSADDTVRATGTVRGRSVTVEITGSSTDQGMQGFLRAFRPPQRQRRARAVWHTRMAVSCENPAELRGAIESVVDVTDPAWDPRNYDPAHGRVVRTDPVELRDRIITPGVHDKLMEIIVDARFELDAHELRLDDTSSASAGSSYVAASPVHSRNGPIVPWPERALVGPPWWIELMCDLADGVDAVS